MWILVGPFGGNCLCSITGYSFLYSLPFTPLSVLIYLVADSYISTQLFPQQTLWLQRECWMRNKLGTCHLKENEHIISALHIVPTQRLTADPTSQICYLLSLHRWVSTFWYSAFEFSLFIRLLLLAHQDPTTCCHRNCYSQPRWW